MHEVARIKTRSRDIIVSVRADNTGAQCIAIEREGTARPLFATFDPEVAGAVGSALRAAAEHMQRPVKPPPPPPKKKAMLREGRPE